MAATPAGNADHPEAFFRPFEDLTQEGWNADVRGCIPDCHVDSCPIVLGEKVLARPARYGRKVETPRPLKLRRRIVEECERVALDDLAQAVDDGFQRVVAGSEAI